MTDRELDRLAGLIADALLGAAGRPPPGARSRPGTWVPAPVRPEPPGRPGEAPVWSGAAQSLDDVAPGRANAAPRARASTAELTTAARAAAAGRGAPPQTASGSRRTLPAGRRRSPRAAAIDVSIGVSNRHVHLSPAHFRSLFGRDIPAVAKPIGQPGQFAAVEAVDVVGPGGKIERVRVVGPNRGDTQLELASSDCRTLGVTAPVRASGSLTQSAGGVALVGPAGSVQLTRGVIVAARHLHLSSDDAAGWGFRDGDVLTVRVGNGPRALALHDVLVRSGTGHATELHLDSDEAHAAGVRTGDRASIVTWTSAPALRRGLVTERDVVDLARRGGSLPADAILTPSARDRARSLGLVTP